MKLLLLRADASATIGSGHVMRCLALAEAWRAGGGRALFACREHPGNLCERIEAAGFEVTRLPMGTEAETEAMPVHAHWLGASLREELEAMRGLLARQAVAPEWIVVDHYALDQRWERGVGGERTRILAIDDLADRDHDCALLLDQNLVAEMHERYRSRLPAGRGLLLGPEYALLHPDYAPLHRQARARTGVPRRILAFFGGADPVDMSARMLEAFRACAGAGLSLDLVLPFARSAPPVGADEPVWLHQGLSTLAPLMAAADFAFGAGGSTSWERLCLGLPAAVVATAENQRPIAEELGRRGLVEYLGFHEQVDVPRLQRALQAVAAITDLESRSQRCLQVVDGLGATRVAAVMAAERSMPLRARAVDASDEAILLEWANDPETRRHAFSPERIDPATHHAWLQRRLAEAGDCRFYIIETLAGVGIGSVRFQREDAAWEVHFSLSTPFRGRGLGAPLVATGLGQLRADNMRQAEVFGRVKAGNSASSRIFETLAFEAAPETTADVLTYRRWC